MSPVHIDELNPETRAKVLEQISGTESGTTALATVQGQSLGTLGDPAQMTTDQLADIVIDGVKKLRTIMPSILELKVRFDDGQRDSSNRLVEPIRNCHSWSEFCTTHLDRTPSALTKVFARSKAPKVLEHAEPEVQTAESLLTELLNSKINRIEGDAFARLIEDVLLAVKTDSSEIPATITALLHAAKVLAGIAEMLRKVQS